MALPPFTLSVGRGKGEGISEIAGIGDHSPIRTLRFETFLDFWAILKLKFLALETGCVFPRDSG